MSSFPRTDGGSLLGHSPENGSGARSVRPRVREQSLDFLDVLLTGEPAELDTTGDAPEPKPEQDDPVEPEEVEAAADESVSDVGFFLSMAGRYPLLSARRERELAVKLWQARRCLFRAIRLAQGLRGDASFELRRVGAAPLRKISQTTRRRLLAAERYAERLVRLVDSGALGSAPSNGSDPLPWVEPPRRRGPKAFGGWAPRLNRKQILSVAPVLREELETIRAIREEVVEHNLRLVIWVAKGYRGRGLDLVDLIQEGNLGLLRAIDRFDPAIGTRFSTFATHWVRQGIGRALAEKSRAVRIPLNRLPEVRETLATQARLTETLRRAPRVEEIARAMNADIDKVRELLLALSPVDSIDALLPSGDLHLADAIADTSSPTPLERAIEEETVRSVQRLLGRMPERERLILEMRYGIGHPKECTLEEIGRAMGLSRERIRQIEKVAQGEFRWQWDHSRNGRGSRS